MNENTGAVPERGVRWISPPGCPGLFGAHHPGKSDAEAGAGTSPGGGTRLPVPRQRREPSRQKTRLRRRLRTGRHSNRPWRRAGRPRKRSPRALAEAEAQVAALREKVNDLEPGAESWRRIKDTAGDIEVSAHERAQRIIQSAQDQAAEIRAEGVRWILELQARCQRLKEDLHTSLFSAETELDSVRAAFSQAQEDVEGMQGALADLAAYAQKEPLK